MAYFLSKTEPAVYSFDDLAREGEVVWDGVTNNLALKNLRLMKAGDTCFFYHSGEEKAVVGIAKVTRAAYPDPKKKDEKLSVVNIVSVRRLANPVSLAKLKSFKGLETFDLIRLPRLSVMEVPGKIRDLIIKLSKEKQPWGSGLI